MSKFRKAFLLGLICCAIFALVSGVTMLCIELAGQFSVERPALALVTILSPSLAALIACLAAMYMSR